jgi:hypothetical protein
MKKITIITFLLFLFAGCDKDMINKWLLDYEYKIPLISAGFAQAFPFQHEITIARYISGSGVLKIKNTQSQTVTYTQQGCWYQDMYGYWYWNPATTVTYEIKSEEVLSFHFDWHRYGNNNYIHIDFNNVDPRTNHTDPALLQSLNGKYKVHEVWPETGTLFAGRIQLQGQEGNGNEIILDRH